MHKSMATLSFWVALIRWGNRDTILQTTGLNTHLPLLHFPVGVTGGQEVVMGVGHTVLEGWSQTPLLSLQSLEGRN